MGGFLSLLYDLLAVVNKIFFLRYELLPCSWSVQCVRFVFLKYSLLIVAKISPSLVVVVHRFLLLSLLTQYSMPQTRPIES